MVTQERSEPSQNSTNAHAPLLLSPAVSLKLLVFVAGIVLMGLEIAGSRVLAPHFGNSVFVWGSLISVFLIALAIGYYAGGILVDVRPSQRLLGAICMFASVWIFALASMGYAIGAAIAESGFDAEAGPLLAAAILFLPPSVALGMVSPFSVRIAATTVQSVGLVAGTLNALSTIGCIVGTLATTFVLIPNVGVTGILRSYAVLLLCTALITLPWRRSLGSVTPLLLALVVMAASLLLPASAQTIRLAPGEKILHDEQTPYHHIVVTESSQTGTRELRFERDVESGIFLRPNYPSSVAYPDYFHLAFLARPQMERVLFIGAGGGVGPRTFLAHNPKLQIDVVDIDPTVLDVAERYFYLPKVPAINRVAKDGRLFVREAQNRYDCIVLDAFTGGGRIPFHLVTRECLELYRSRLKPGGVFVMNMGSALEGRHGGVFQAMQRTTAQVFSGIDVFAHNYRKVGKTSVTNIIMLAGDSNLPLAASDWRSRAEQHASGEDPQIDLIKLLTDQVSVPAPNAAAPVFTDDFAAIETMTL
jgi:spermidine synthase